MNRENTFVEIAEGLFIAK